MRNTHHQRLLPFLQFLVGSLVLQAEVSLDLDFLPKPEDIAEIENEVNTRVQESKYVTFTFENFSVLMLILN